MALSFRVQESGVLRGSDPGVYLVADNWDDWFTYSTMYDLVVIEAGNPNVQVMGQVKIGQFNWRKDQRRPDLDPHFTDLDERYFSLGQDASYYERLNKLASGLGEDILRDLRDLAWTDGLFERALNEDVTQTSLLRSVQPNEVRGQFRRLAHGGARLTKFAFDFTADPLPNSELPGVHLSFLVEPHSSPPTNVHVIIGSNGVGKTHLLDNMTKSLFGEADAKGRFSRPLKDDEQESFFVNVVQVSFSAFDAFSILPSVVQQDAADAEQKKRSGSRPFTYVGLRHFNPETGEESTRTPTELGADFVTSLKELQASNKIARWERALQLLEGDPLFADYEVAALGRQPAAEMVPNATDLYGQLSSGHKIVLLTITRLVETLAEQSLVLLDEPEAHLHPPLLSAFVRALSTLLIERNGVSIIATHSPVVLQEVPKSCVWRLRRAGNSVVAERPEAETFGENVGVLTREVFGLEVTQTGFHKMLADAVAEADDLEHVAAAFGDQLGAEARRLVRTMLAEKARQGRPLKAL